MVYQALSALKGKDAEDFLRTQILLPALRHKYGSEKVHDWCGPYERGADVGCWVEGPSGRKELVGIVITVGHITKPICQKILNQAEQALMSGHPTSQVGGTDEANAGRAWAVVTDPWESWTEGARILWKDKCVPQSILRDVEAISPSHLSQLICANDPGRSIRRKLLERAGLWEPISVQPVRPSELRSALSLIATQPRWAALRVSKLAITHWLKLNRSEATVAVRGALKSREVPFMARKLLAGWLAEHPSTDSAVQSLVQEVLEDAVLARHFLAQMHDSPEWLKVMSPVFEQLAQEGLVEVKRTLGHTVARVCKDERDLALGFLRLLWPTQDHGVGLGCIRIIEELNLWEEVEDLLEQAAKQRSPILSFMPFALMSAVRRGDVSSSLATKWLATWTLSQMGEGPVGAPHFKDSLKHAFGEVVEKDPASVLPYAAKLVEANCEAGDQLGDERYGLKDTDLRAHLQFRIDVRGSREEPALVVLTALLQLAEAGIHIAELGAEIEKLLESEYTAARVIGIKVCRANPKEFVPQCVTALTDGRNLVHPLGEVAGRLLSAAYHLLSKKKRKEVDDVLLRLKSETEREDYKGITRLYALKSIPEEHRTEEVKAEIIRLLEENERLRDIDFAPEPEMQVGFQPAPVSDIAKQIDSMTVEQVIELLHKAENSDPHGIDRYDVGHELRRRAEDNSEFALQLAGELASATSLASRYAAELLWGIREAHTWDHRMEVIWRLRKLDDSGVHGVAANIIEQAAPDLRGKWVHRARLLLYKWATDRSPAATGEADADLLMTGINSARGRVAEALLRIAGEHGLKRRSSDVLRALAGDKSPAVRACVLGKLGHLRRDHYSFSLDLFERATRGRKDDRVLQYTIWYARYIKSKDYQRYVEPVIRRAVQSDDKEVARVGGVLAAWGLIEPQQGSPELEGLLVDTRSAAVIGGAEEVFSVNVFSEDEEIARISREWCLRLMQSGGPDIAHSVVGGLWRQDPIDLRSVLDILLTAAESNDQGAIRNLLQVLEKGVKQFPNEAAEVLSKLWSRETSQQALKQLHIGELHHEVLEELLQNDDVTVANRQLAWDIFDTLLEAGDAWATSQFDEYVKIATTG